MFIFVSPSVAAQRRITHCSDHFKRMANFVCEISVTQEPLAMRASDIAGAGAVVDFCGIVRPLEDGRKIEGIDYEAHDEMAKHQLKRIADQAMEQFGLKRVIIHHRIGFVAVGEASLFLSVASSRRSEGFQATQWMVDELKKKVPIWKRPRFKALADQVDPDTHGDDSKIASKAPRANVPAGV
jgi:molybdopterin synthase catalytic subunit